MPSPFLVDFEHLYLNQKKIAFLDEGMKQLVHLHFKKNQNALRCENPMPLTYLEPWEGLKEKNQIEYNESQHLLTFQESEM
jgi:hypothetical protein